MYQPLAKQFTLYPGSKDKTQDKFKTFYIYVLKTLENPWNNPNYTLNFQSLFIDIRGPIGPYSKFC